MPSIYEHLWAPGTLLGPKEDTQVKYELTHWDVQ